MTQAPARETTPTTPKATLPASARRSPARRLLPWLAVLVVAVLAALAVTALTGPSAVPLDPASKAPSGSHALVRVLAHYGIRLQATTSQATASTAAKNAGTIVVTAPDDYSDAQLRSLRDAAARLVLVRPATRAVRAVLPGAEPITDSGSGSGSGSGGPSADPDCDDPGAQAAAAIGSLDDAIAYLPPRGVADCYGGLVLLAPRVTVLGSAELLTNDRLGEDGNAALAVNLLSASRTIGTVSWLRPGADAAGHGPQSLHDLFPPGAFRALWWLVAVALLLALWCGRRLGGVVVERLPVVVRAAEAIEGHGRLYRRAGARERAGAALRAGTLRRLRVRLHLPPSTSPSQLAAVAAPVIGRTPAYVLDVLGGPPPADDPALQRLGRDLHDLEAAVSAAGPVVHGGDQRAE